MARPALALDETSNFSGHVVLWVSQPNLSAFLDVSVVSPEMAIESREIGGLDFTVSLREPSGGRPPGAGVKWLLALVGDARLRHISRMSPASGRTVTEPAALGPYFGRDAQFFSGDASARHSLRGIPMRPVVVESGERITARMPRLSADSLLSLPGAPPSTNDLPVQGDWYRPQEISFWADVQIDRSPILRVEEYAPVEALVSDEGFVWADKKGFTASVSLEDLRKSAIAERDLFFGALLIGVGIPLVIDALTRLIIPPG